MLRSRCRRRIRHIVSPYVHGTYFEASEKLLSLIVCRRIPAGGELGFLALSIFFPSFLLQLAQIVRRLSTLVLAGEGFGELGGMFGAFDLQLLLQFFVSALESLFRCLVRSCADGCLWLDAVVLLLIFILAVWRRVRLFLVLTNTWVGVE